MKFLPMVFAFMLIATFMAVASGPVYADDIQQGIAPAITSDSEALPPATADRVMAPASTAQEAPPLTDELAAKGAECPIGSSNYCSDTAPWCYMCHGEYSCCYSQEVWRCCD